MRMPMSRDGGVLPAAARCLRSALPATLCFIHFGPILATRTGNKEVPAAFPGKIMVYSRQGYALNHNDDDVRHDDDRNERTTTPTCVSCPPLLASFLQWGACWPLWMPDCDT